MTSHNKINVIFGFSGSFYIHFDILCLKMKLWKNDVTSDGKIMAIFGFSVQNYVYLVTFGRKIKFANFQSLGPPLGLSYAKSQATLLLFDLTLRLNARRALVLEYILKFRIYTISVKAWRTWPTLLAKHHCSRFN